LLANNRNMIIETYKEQLIHCIRPRSSQEIPHCLKVCTM
jgi:hypothetical protein